MYLLRIYEAVSLHCWKKPSTSDRHLCLCCASCLHVTPFSCNRSSRHLLRCLPLDLLPSRGCHSVTLCCPSIIIQSGYMPRLFPLLFQYKLDYVLHSCSISYFCVWNFIFYFQLFSTSGPSLLSRTTFDSHMSYLGDHIVRRLVF